MPEIFAAGADCWDGTGESCEPESGEAECPSCVHEETARNQPIAKRENFIFNKEGRTQNRGAAETESGKIV
jgi:hypothetical protein